MKFDNRFRISGVPDRFPLVENKVIVLGNNRWEARSKISGEP